MRKRTLFPIIVVIAAVIIAGGIYVSRTEAPVTEEINDNKIEIKKISRNDHILGDLNADVVIIEYSDFGCPYCKQFHVTMQRIIDDYAKDGKVAWIYRHFPFEERHKNSRLAALASECVANLEGEDAFWEFSRQVFESAPGSLVDTNLSDIALSLGVDEEKYNSCIEDEKFASRVDQDFQDGLKIYDQDPNFGTPYNIALTRTGEQIEVVGAASYSELKTLIETYSRAF